MVDSPLISPASLPPAGYALSGPQSTSFSTQQAGSQSQSNSYIPNYSETPILENLANYSASMAPQVYQWGMQQYANNQGNIDNLMRNAMSYASPQRQSVDMGQAEAGVQQASEAARQSSIADLQSYGIDPSAGRYASLDQASRVQSAAATAGAGNQQRISDVATGNAMQNQAISSSIQNAANVGYGAANAANQFASTGMSLKYSPLGTDSSSTSQSAGLSQSQSASLAAMPHAEYRLAQGGPVGFQPGGYVPTDVSPSRGAQTDDVNANLNAGEFVIPKDVAAFKGQEFFYKLMAQARKARATLGGQAPKLGYGAS